jgi:hypothetical protein
MAVKKKNSSSDRQKQQRVGKPPPIDEYIKPIIAVIIALLAYQFFKGMTEQEILRVDLENELELRELFFGEDLGTTNYAVLCHPESATYPISSVFKDAAKDGTAPAIFKVVDCDTVMAGSNNTIVQRFKLNEKNRPLVFVSGKQGPPKQVSYVTYREVLRYSNCRLRWMYCSVVLSM